MRAYRKRKIRYNVIPATLSEIVPLSNSLFKELVIPNYDPQKHKTGDTVKYNGHIITVPEFDADGNPVW